jgi:hypothetical protein
MVGFELLTHLLNMAIHNSLVNEMLCCILFMGVVNITCIPVCALVAAFYRTLIPGGMIF